MGMTDLPAGAAGLAAVMLLYLLHRGAVRRRQRSFLRYSNLAFLVESIAAREWPARAIESAAWCGALLVVVALARPQVTREAPLAARVVICIDTSGSMARTDVSPSRAMAAMSAVRTYAENAAKNLRIGLIAFSGRSIVLTAPIADRKRLRELMDSVPAPHGATAIGDALHAAQLLLPLSGERAVILITDGTSNSGSDPVRAARDLGTQGIHLYAVGIGSSARTAGLDALRREASLAAGTFSSATSARSARAALLRLKSTIGRRRVPMPVGLEVAVAGGALLIAAFVARSAA